MPIIEVNFKNLQRMCVIVIDNKENPYNTFLYVLVEVKKRKAELSDIALNGYKRLDNEANAYATTHDHNFGDLIDG